MNAKTDTASARLLHVGQAGECGSQQIYAAQLDVFSERASHPGEIAQTAAQEASRWERFIALIAARGVCPTLPPPKK